MVFFMEPSLSTRPVTVLTVSPTLLMPLPRLFRKSELKVSPRPADCISKGTGLRTQLSNGILHIRKALLHLIAHISDSGFCNPCRSVQSCWNCVFRPESPDINWDWIPLPTSLAALPIPL